MATSDIYMQLIGERESLENLWSMIQIWWSTKVEKGIWAPHIGIFSKAISGWSSTWNCIGIEVMNYNWIFILLE